MTEVVTFTGGATRESDVDKLDYEGFLSPLVLERFAQYMHKHRLQADGAMRSSDNWQGGMPRQRYLKSLVRHVWELWALFRGRPLSPKTARDPQDVEEVLCAIFFNTQGLLLEFLLKRDLKG